MKKLAKTSVDFCPVRRYSLHKTAYVGYRTQQERQSHERLDPCARGFSSVEVHSSRIDSRMPGRGMTLSLPHLNSSISAEHKLGGAAQSRLTARHTCILSSTCLKDLGRDYHGLHELWFEQPDGVSGRGKHPLSGPKECGRSRGFCISESSDLSRLRLFLVHDTSARIGASIALLTNRWPDRTASIAGSK